MKLTTTVEIAKTGIEIGYATPVLLIGSCFAERIGERMREAGLETKLNPFGILYNPHSIAESIRYCLEGRGIEDCDMVEYNGLWHSWLHHGDYSHESHEGCKEKCNREIAEVHSFMERCRVVVVTLGSAWCYRLKTGVQTRKGKVVGNCHKVPSTEFEKELLMPESIVEEWSLLLEELLAREITTLFTISPIRHWAYGAHGNQIGKASLIMAVHELVERYGGIVRGDATVSYFPAYEIMMDELRDYRYYADDMLHPSNLAEEIIWERFQNSYMSAQTIEAMGMKERLNKMEGHRPIKTTGDEWERFQQKVNQYREEVANKIATLRNK